MAMDSYPKMFRIFIAKQVSGWCGTNSKRSLWDTCINNICLNCGMINKTSKHMIRCKDHGHIALLQETIDEVLSNLEKANAAILLIEIVEMYLLSQGLQTMESCSDATLLDPRINLGGTVL